MMPDGKDPDDYIKENGKENLLKLLGQKEIIQSFVWNYQLNKINIMYCHTIHQHVSNKCITS